eukprot:712540-Rhodomonas_salina.2
MSCAISSYCQSSSAPKRTLCPGRYCHRLNLHAIEYCLGPTCMFRSTVTGSALSLSGCAATRLHVRCLHVRCATRLHVRCLHVRCLHVRCPALTQATALPGPQSLCPLLPLCPRYTPLSPYARPTQCLILPSRTYARPSRCPVSV